MRCPYCLAQDTGVIDSRLSEGGDAVRRRRECASCHKRFSTYEKAAVAEPAVVKRDGRKEQFSRDKLLRGFLRACEKRPIARELIDAAVDAIEAQLRSERQDEIPTITHEPPRLNESCEMAFDCAARCPRPRVTFSAGTQSQ